MGKMARYLRLMSQAGGFTAAIFFIGAALIVLARQDLARVAFSLKLSEAGKPQEIGLIAETSVSRNPVIRKALLAYLDNYTGPLVREIGLSMLLNGRARHDMLRGFTPMELCALTLEGMNGHLRKYSRAELAQVKAALEYLIKIDFIQVSHYAYKDAPPTDYRLNSFGLATFSALREEMVSTAEGANAVGKLDASGRPANDFARDVRDLLADD
jgi:hypothetical protein